MLVLGPFEADNATEENDGKQGTIYLYSTWYLKIIFTLLTKIVAVYVEFFEIDF